MTFIIKFGVNIYVHATHVQLILFVFVWNLINIDDKLYFMCVEMVVFNNSTSLVFFVFFLYFTSLHQSAIHCYILFQVYYYWLYLFVCLFLFICTCVDLRFVECLYHVIFFVFFVYFCFVFYINIMSTLKKI